jgi:N-methylhydantoinase B
LTVRRDVEMLIDDVSLARYGDRQRFGAFGLFGGKEGSKGKFILNPGTPEERQLKSKGLDILHKGDVVSLRMPGAGGYSDPLERDSEMLLQDVRDGKVTLESAREDYQVVIDSATLQVDEEATRKLREG